MLPACTCGWYRRSLGRKLFNWASSMPLLVQASCLYLRKAAGEDSFFTGRRAPLSDNSVCRSILIRCVAG
jgi:hypothetical protein